MGKGLTLDIAANTRDFQRGTKDVEGALDDVADALDDVSRDGEKSTEKLERSFSEAQREISRSAKKIEHDLKDTSKQGFGKAGEAAKGFKEEATANFQEMASSFDGSMESLSDAAQGTLGGLATAIGGPLGLGLAGLGALGGAFAAQWAASAEQTKQNVSDMYEDMLESGQNYLSEEFLNRKIQELIEDEGKLARLKQTQLATGLDLNTVILAELSAGTERDKVQAALNDKLEQSVIIGGRGHSISESATAELRFQVQHYKDLNGEQDAAIDKTKIVRDAWDRVASRSAETTKSIETQGDRLKAQAETLGKMPREITVTVTADTRELDRVLQSRRSIPVDLVTRSGKKVAW